MLRRALSLRAVAAQRSRGRAIGAVIFSVKWSFLYRLHSGKWPRIRALLYPIAGAELLSTCLLAPLRRGFFFVAAPSRDNIKAPGPDPLNGPRKLRGRPFTGGAISWADPQVCPTRIL